MTRPTATPSSNLRTLIKVRLVADESCHWPKVQSLLFAHSGRQVDVAGQSVFVFDHGADALRGLLSLPTVIGKGRVAVHVGDLAVQPVAPEWLDLGAPAQVASGSGFDVLERLLDACAPGQRLLSRTAEVLLQRAARGQHLVMPGTWPCRVGAGEDAINALSLEPVASRVALADELPLQITRQPLPNRPHWWLDTPLPDLGPLQRGLLHNHKSGQYALLLMAHNDEGRQYLHELNAAQQQCAALRNLGLDPGDGELGTLPAFMVSGLSGRRLLSQSDPIIVEPSVPELMRAVAQSLSLAHANGCAHGALDSHALAIGHDSSIRLHGLRQLPMPMLQTCQMADIRALARLLFGLFAKALDEPLPPFWERRITLPQTRALIAACLDPAHEQPVTSIAGFIEALDTLTSSGPISPAPKKTVRWWARRR